MSLWKEIDGNRTYFVYCDEGLAGELDSNGSLTKAYGWEPNSTWTTNPVFMREGESYYYYHNDHLGTPQKLTAVNGAVAWSAKYTAFGEAEIDLASTITNNLRFPGQYQDEETQLHYNYHRYYEPRSGRYITADPIGINGGINLFSYVFNNSVNFYDYNGLRVTCDIELQHVSLGFRIVQIEMGAGFLDCEDDCGVRKCYSFKLFCGGGGPGAPITIYGGVQHGGFIGSSVNSFGGPSLQFSGSAAGIIGASGAVSISLSGLGVGGSVGLGGGLSFGISASLCWTFGIKEIPCLAFSIPSRPPEPLGPYPIPPRPNPCGGYCR